MSGTEPTEPVASAPAAVAAPIVEAPAVAPAPVVAPVAEVVPEAPKPVEPVVEAPKAQEPAKPAEPEKSLLETAGEKAPEPAKPAEAEPAPVVAYEFKLPEGFTAVPEQMQAASALFSEAGVKPEQAQKLVDLHTASLKQYAEKLVADQFAAFDATKNAWRTETLADPELGGSGHQTAMNAVGTGRDALVPQQDRAEFAKMLNDTGIGNNPAFLRVFYRAAQRFREAAPPPPNPLPPPGRGPAPTKAGVSSLFTSTAHKAALGKG